MIPGISFKFDESDVKRTQQFLDRKYKHYSNWTPLLKRISLLMFQSVIRNFEEQGRPEKWEPLHKLTRFIRRFRVHAPAGTGKMMILQDRGRLKGSLMPGIFETDKQAVATVGTTVDYAKKHQLGGRSESSRVTIKNPRYNRYSKPKGKKTYEMKIKAGHTIPKRPFLMFQREDQDSINIMVKDFLNEQ